MNCEIKLEVKTTEMFKNARGAVRLFPTFNTNILIVFQSYCVRFITAHYSKEICLHNLSLKHSFFTSKMAFVSKFASIYCLFCS